MFAKCIFADHVAARVIAGVVCASLVSVASAQSVKPTVTVVNPVSNPVNTRITNSVVAVEVSNADPIPTMEQSTTTDASKFFSANIESTHGATTVGSGGSYRSVPSDVALTGFTMSVLAPPASIGTCRTTFTLVEINGPNPDDDELLYEALYRVEVNQGQTVVSPFIPLPNLIVPEGYVIRVRTTGNYEPNQGHECKINLTYQGVRQ